MLDTCADAVALMITTSLGPFLGPGRCRVHPLHGCQESQAILSVSLGPSHDWLPLERHLKKLKRSRWMLSWEVKLAELGLRHALGPR